MKTDRETLMVLLDEIGTNIYNISEMSQKMFAEDGITFTEMKLLEGLYNTFQGIRGTISIIEDYKPF